MSSPQRQRVRHGDGAVATLRVDLDGVDVFVSRRLLVSTRATLLELHAIFQRAFGQHESAEHRFDVDGVAYHDPEGGQDELHSTELNDLRSLGLHAGLTFVHESPTPSSAWRHSVVVEQLSPRLTGQRLPLCIEGEGASPPEDCDGPEEYGEMLAALASPYDPEAAELRQWLPEQFDPTFCDVPAINVALSKVPRLRADR
jgi:hypothetical protein